MNTFRNYVYTNPKYTFKLIFTSKQGCYYGSVAKILELITSSLDISRLISKIPLCLTMNFSSIPYPVGNNYTSNDI